METSPPGNQSRELPIVTSRRTRAVKRPQASSASILTEKGFCSGLSCRKFCVYRFKCDAVDGRGFARDTVVIHGIDAVRGDVHLVDRAIACAEIEDAFDGDAPECEVFSELRVADREFR